MIYYVIGLENTSPNQRYRKVDKQMQISSIQTKSFHVLRGKEVRTTVPRRSEEGKWIQAKQSRTFRATRYGIGWWRPQQGAS
jgi:hypothetical protein